MTTTLHSPTGTDTEPTITIWASTIDEAEAKLAAGTLADLGFETYEPHYAPIPSRAGRIPFGWKVRSTT